MGKGNKAGWVKHHKLLTSIGVLLLLIIIGTAVGGNKKVANTSATNDSGSTIPVHSADQLGVNQGNEQPAPAADPNPHFSDGTYLVGQDIQPGTYRMRVAPTADCYYARLNSLNTGDIVANDNTYAPAIITIGASDKAFISKGCGMWTEDLSAITTDKTSFSDGIYIVGTDIQPGTYKSSGQTGCYWQRVSDFNGGSNSILQNDNTDAPVVVKILPTDKGFKSARCGTWTLQQ